MGALSALLSPLRQRLSAAPYRGPLRQVGVEVDTHTKAKLSLYLSLRDARNGIRWNRVDIHRGLLGVPHLPSSPLFSCLELGRIETGPPRAHGMTVAAPFIRFDPPRLSTDRHGGNLCLLHEAHHERKRSVGDLTPAAVDDEPMPAVGDLDDLRDCLVALLPLVGRVRDRPGRGVVLLAGDDQQRSPVGVVAVDLGAVRGFRLAVAAWTSGAPDAGTAKVAYSCLASSSLTALAKP